MGGTVAPIVIKDMHCIHIVALTLLSITICANTPSTIDRNKDVKIWTKILVGTVIWMNIFS